MKFYFKFFLLLLILLPLSGCNLFQPETPPGSVSITPSEGIIGEMWFHNDTSAAQVTIIDIEDTWYNITGFNTTTSSGRTLRGFEYNSTMTGIKSTVSGIYDIDYAVSFTGGINTHYQLAIAVDGVRQDDTDSHRQIGTSNDVGNTGGTGTILLNASSMITLMIQNLDNTNNPVVLAANFNLHKIGTY